MSAAQPLVSLQDVHRSYRVGPTDVHVLRGVQLEIHRGELASLMGASGSGKSTLMNIIGMLERPSSGDFFFEGRDVLQLAPDALAHYRNQQIGFVFQTFHLLPRLTALDNVGLPLLYQDVSKREMRRRAREILGRVGMGDRVDHRPNELSGGQRQRVAIARALVGNPSVVLADEPTGALDSSVGREIMDLFHELNGEGVTVVIITHDPAIARECPRQLVIRDGVVAGPEQVPA
ncbi:MULTISPECIES: ABC transporter ATP-binding protein [unclassified Thioalkalivibrio]|uniref:ABC transporter ATP-binding protein n=1 Tax=unclassified Thioalkalivibrio TaxID=2621013 RepID=UPI00037445E7|nr:MULTISPECIES: ABC transporter ATP-binding protein [unclassified Thioalkalivibrio]